jgi:hypothetical protein
MKGFTWILVKVFIPSVKVQLIHCKREDNFILYWALVCMGQMQRQRFGIDLCLFVSRLLKSVTILASKNALIFVIVKF